MARKGDGIFKRGNVWRLDCYINGQRYQISLGKGINRTKAAEIASVKRAAILRGEVGIIIKKKDLPFTKAADLFLQWTKAHKATRTYNDYKACIDRLTEFFGGKDLSQISPFLIESYKIRRTKEGAKVRPNRELSLLRNIYNKERDIHRHLSII